MSEIQDDYLWTGEGSASDEVAALEDELSNLRWRPRPLKLFQDSIDVDPTVTVARVVSIAAPRRRPRWSATWIAGIAAAAAVLMLVFWLRPRPAPTAAPTAVDPTGRPLSPDLKDPFSRAGANDQRGFTTPITDPPPPPPAASTAVSPDLKDPFANSSKQPRVRPDPGGLKDPFTGQRRPTPTSPDLVDPFKNSPQLRDPTKSPSSQPTRDKSPDLKDPFTNN